MRKYKKMKKIVLSEHEIEYKIIEHEGQKILVKPYADLSDKRIILSALSESENSDKINKFIESQMGLMLSVIDIMTNIDIKNLNIDWLVTSGLWDSIKQNIKNYSEIYSSYKEIRESEQLPAKLSSIMSKAEAFIDKMSQIDFSDKNIKKMTKELSEGLSKLSTVYPTVQPPTT